MPLSQVHSSIKFMKNLLGRIFLFAIFGAVSPSHGAAITYSDSASFTAALDKFITDDFSAVGYAAGRDVGSSLSVHSDAYMTSVVNETQYKTTGFRDLNLVGNLGNGFGYCAGCNGSFQLDFTSTTVGTAAGVFGVGLTLLSSAEPQYTAFVTFGDGSTANYSLPLSSSVSNPFVGLTSNLSIRSIDFGLRDGVTTQEGQFAISNLTIGSAAIAQEPGISIASTFISESVSDGLNSLSDPINSLTGFVLEVVDKFINISLNIGIYGDLIADKTVDYLGTETVLSDLWEFGIESIWNRGGAYAEASYEGVDYKIKFDVEFDEIQFPTNLSPDFLVRGIDQAYVEGTSKPIWNAVEWYADYQNRSDILPVVAAHEFGHLIGLPDEYCRRGRHRFNDSSLCTNFPWEDAENRNSGNLMVDLTPIVLDRHYALLLSRINQQLGLDFVLGELPPFDPLDFVVPTDYRVQDAYFATTKVSEPGTLALLGFGVAVMGTIRRRRSF
jgi:hypothetical protein